MISYDHSTKCTVLLFAITSAAIFMAVSENTSGLATCGHPAAFTVVLSITLMAGNAV